MVEPSVELTEKIPETHVPPGYVLLNFEGRFLRMGRTEIKNECPGIVALVKKICLAKADIVITERIALHFHDGILLAEPVQLLQTCLVFDLIPEHRLYRVFFKGDGIFFL